MFVQAFELDSCTVHANVFEQPHEREYKGRQNKEQRNEGCVFIGRKHN